MKLDPLSIPELAKAMAYEEWLDMRVVGLGTAERVRVHAIVIYREREEVELFQEYVSDDSSTVGSSTVRVEAENIWWARPTVFELGDVHPLVPPASANVNNEYDQIPGALLTAACRAVAENVGMDYQEFSTLFAGSPQSQTRSTTSSLGPFTRLRYQVMWIVWEVTDLPDDVICRCCGWRSKQPFVSARYLYSEYHSGAYVGKPEYAALFRQLVRRTREISGRQWRRSDPAKYGTFILD